MLNIAISYRALAKCAAGAIIFCSMLGAMTLSAATGAPGSSEDPLVSKSYVDQKVAEILSASGGVGEAGKQALADEIISRLEPLIGARGGGGTFAPVRAAMGQTLVGGEGTEIILRSGSAVVHLNGSDGVSDVTSGRSLGGGETVAANHLIIIPRNDGRGIRVQSGEAWFIVKGAYSIK